MRDIFNADLRENDHIYGYSVKRVLEVPNINSWFYELEHIGTKARHIHISRDDQENAFSVAFKTVPADSSGVAHILEHTVLCGSRKYPVHDPFFSMLRRSLNTFMNAFTASDWTMYPFCTQNRKDYNNLLDVYLDAVFYPRLDRFSFMQEGCRVELEGTDTASARLVYKGIVYNEMKGAMSSPDEVMGRSILNALYPSSTYRFNSGGDPAIIPQLTYNDLVAFHRRHYHPSNAFFYTYGNFPLADHLEYIQKTILSKFEYQNPDTVVPSQDRWHEPKVAEYRYPVADKEDAQGKTQVCLAWLMSDIKNSFEVLSLTILERVLLGNVGSPLYKALISSGLGTALADNSGFDSGNRDTLFSCGLKGVEVSSADKIADIILEVLAELADKGIDQRLIDSAIHRIEFQRKEVSNVHLPYSLKLLLSFVANWFHGGDPLRILNFDEDIRRIDAERSRTGFFEDLIRRYWLNNNHRVRLTLIPDTEMEKIENQRVLSELEQLKASMTPDMLENIVREAEELRRKSEETADLSVLPSLELEDIPPQVAVVKETAEDTAISSVYYEQPTSGILYINAAFGIGGLNQELLLDIPFFCYAFAKMGTKKHHYTELAQMLELYTGGLGIAESVHTGFGALNQTCVPLVMLSGKALERNQERLFDIVQEMMCSYDFSDIQQLEKLWLEYRAGLESTIVDRGHLLAISLAARNFSVKRRLQELWGGVAQIQYIKSYNPKPSSEQLALLADKMNSTAKILFRRGNIRLALIGGQSALAGAADQAAKLSLELEPGGTGCLVQPQFQLNHEPIREGWSTSSAVSFVVRTFMTAGLEHEDAPALAVISKLLKSLYVHKEVREKGGAYGGFAFQADDGLFGFASYRDPHILPTLQVYQQAADFIRSGKYSTEDVKECILEICSDIDKPDAPGTAAGKSFVRKLIFLSDEMRQHYKTRLIALTRKNIMQTVDKYFPADCLESNVVVISGETQLTQANQELDDMPLTLHRI